MTEGLPEGLITTKEDVRESIESVDRVDVEDIARLWKGMPAKAVLAEDVGHRLENFFWRIWGSDRLWGRMSGNLVAAIFSKISEGGYIRTTPTQSPRSSRSLGTFHRPQKPEGQYAPLQPDATESISSVTELPGEDDAGNAEETETESVSASRRRLPPRSSPILKKTKAVSPAAEFRNLDAALQHRRHAAVADAHGTSSLGESRTSIVPDPQHVGGTTEVSRSAYGNPGSKNTRFTTDKGDPQTARQSMAEEVDNTEHYETHGKSRQRTGRRKVTVVANTAASRRRPVLRQRSSQSSSSSASVASSAQSEVERTAHQTLRNIPAGVDASTNAESGISSMLKRQRTQQGDTQLDQDLKLGFAAPQQALDTDQAVNLGMRRHPSSRTLPSHRSLTSLPSILKKSSAATVTSAPYQASGTMDLGQQPRHKRGRVSEEIMAESGDQPGIHDNPQPEQQTGSVQALSRSKSQLTLLLQKDRKPDGDL
ncbi:MAG: hypothetical protein Q9218_001464 [Villophora microphyllina]